MSQNAITERRWRDLFRRLLDRDRGQEDYDRLELYLDDSARRATPTPARQKNPWEEILGDYLGKVATPGELTKSEDEYVWFLAMERLSGERDRAGAFNKLKRQLAKYLLAEAPAIAASADALRKQIARKWDAWKASGGNARAIRDKRTAPFRKVAELPAADLLKTGRAYRFQRGGTREPGRARIESRWEITGKHFDPGRCSKQILRAAQSAPAIAATRE